MPTITKRQRKNGCSYRVQLRIAGFQAQSQTFATLKDARAWALDTEHDMINGRFEPVRVSRTKTINHLFDRYTADWLDVADLDPKYIAGVKTRLKWWRGQIGGHTLFNVHPSLVTEKRTALLKRGFANGTVNLYLSALSNAFNKAVDEYQWTSDNPVKNVEWLEPHERTRYLQKHEIDIILAECAKERRIPLLPIVAIALQAGLRKEEVSCAMLENLDMENHTLLIPTTKNKKPKQVTITGVPWQLLQDWIGGVRAEIGSVWLFPCKSGANHVYTQVWECFTDACRRAGLKDFHFHDCRHTAGAFLAMSGQSQKVIQEYLGHSTLKASQRYQHIHNDHKAQVAADISTQMFAGVLEDQDQLQARGR